MSNKKTGLSVSGQSGTEAMLREILEAQRDHSKRLGELTRQIDVLTQTVETLEDRIHIVNRRVRRAELLGDYAPSAQGYRIHTSRRYADLPGAALHEADEDQVETSLFR